MATLAVASASRTPAIYTDERLAEYRSWLPVAGLEGFASIGGSFASDNIEDYYTTPWDLGYQRNIKFDHDFVGRAALQQLAEQPHRRKVWLRWNPSDVARVFTDNLYRPPGQRPQSLELPITSFTHFQFDQVQRNGQLVGLATFSGYTVNINEICSLAMVDETEAIDGADAFSVHRWPMSSRIGKSLMLGGKSCGR